MDSLDLTDEPHPRFPVHGHIGMSVGGDAPMSLIVWLVIDSKRNINLCMGFVHETRPTLV